MADISVKRSKKSGLPAGSLIHIGEKKVQKTRIKVIDYGEKDYVEQEIENTQQCFTFKDDKTITWINIDGISDTDILKELGKCFGFHPLILEDILNTEQRPDPEQNL